MKIAPEKSSFQGMIAPLEPTLPPWGAGAHCDAPVLPEREISQRLRRGNTAQSQPGDARAAGAEPGKAAVSGILKRGGNVYTVVAEDTKSSTLMPVITRKTAHDSNVCTGTYKSYNALDAGSFHHQRINHLTTLPGVRISSRVLKISGIRPKEC
jgi:transposase-like protein